MSAQYLVTSALAGLIGGALLMPPLVFIGIKLNLKNLRTLYAHIHQDRSFYRIWSVFGGVLGAAYVTAIPVIGSYGIKDPWFGLIMIAIGLGLFVPLISVLKRHIQRGS